MKHIVDSPLVEPPPQERRSFLKRAAAIVVGSLVALFPLAASVGVIFSPLRRRAVGDVGGDAGGDAIHYLRVGPLDLLPADGVPRQFVLTDNVVDAWTRTPAQRIGSAFLARSDGPDGPRVTALSSVCPHLGCAVDFNATAGDFECPCHVSAFAKDGAKLYGPSLRGLDPLAVKIVETDGRPEIWVERARFRTGIAERILVG